MKIYIFIFFYCIFFSCSKSITKEKYMESYGDDYCEQNLHVAKSFYEKNKSKDITIFQNIDMTARLYDVKKNKYIYTRIEVKEKSGISYSLGEYRTDKEKHQFDSLLYSIDFRDSSQYLTKQVIGLAKLYNIPKERSVVFYKKYADSIVRKILSLDRAIIAVRSKSNHIEFYPNTDCMLVYSKKDSIALKGVSKNEIHKLGRNWWFVCSQRRLIDVEIYKW